MSGNCNTPFITWNCLRWWGGKTCPSPPKSPLLPVVQTTTANSLRGSCGLGSVTMQAYWPCLERTHGIPQPVCSWVSNLAQRGVLEINPRSSCIYSPFLLCAEELCTVQMFCFACLLFSWQTSQLFPVWGVTKNADRYIPVQVFQWTCVFSSLGQIPGSGTGGLQVGAY